MSKKLFSPINEIIKDARKMFILVDDKIVKMRET